MVGLTVTYPKKTYSTHCASQVCCSQSSYTRGRLLLTRTSTGDIETLKVKLDAVSCGVVGVVLVHTRFCLSPQMSLVSVIHVYYTGTLLVW